MLLLSSELTTNCINPALDNVVHKVAFKVAAIRSKTDENLDYDWEMQVLLESWGTKYNTRKIKASIYHTAAYFLSRVHMAHLISSQLVSSELKRNDRQQILFSSLQFR